MGIAYTLRLWLSLPCRWLLFLAQPTLLCWQQEADTSQEFITARDREPAKAERRGSRLLDLSQQLEVCSSAPEAELAATRATSNIC